MGCWIPKAWLGSVGLPGRGSAGPGGGWGWAFWARVSSLLRNFWMSFEELWVQAIGRWVAIILRSGARKEIQSECHSYAN